MEGSLYFPSYDEEEVLRRKKEEYRAVIRRKNRKKRLIKARLILAGLVLFVALIMALIIYVIIKLLGSLSGTTDELENFSSAFGQIEVLNGSVEEGEEGPGPEPEEPERVAGTYQAFDNGDVAGMSEDVIGTYAILVDADNAKIMAGRDYKTRINPASMTKVLTLLVAVEHMERSELSSPFQLTFDMTNYAYAHDCSVAGFNENEIVTVEDLLYGTILPSGGDAAVALASYISGSQEDFVVLMNEKLKELGLSETTHFTNCVGLFDEDHYSTPYDIAMIMWAAMDNELCREVLTTKKYTTSSTAEHPDGLELSNWFLRRIEDKECGLTVLGGKTGFVTESGNCAVSLASDDTGHEYICVIAGSRSAWRCIYDHVAVYSRFFNPDYVPMTSKEADDRIEEDKEEEQTESEAGE